MSGSNLLGKFLRRRRLQGDAMKTELNRCLTTFDLILIGIGGMVGSGMYVLAGEIAHEITGPALVVSFLIAAIASGMSAWCYAEFGARVPKAGSAYTYTYLTIGELLAFVIGWNLVMEHVIGAAAVSRGLLGYINAISNNAIIKATPEALLSRNFDPYAPIIIVFLALVVCMGIRQSVFVNNVLTCVNLAVAFFFIICGIILADTSNWTNFAPNGISSIFEGAAQAYYAFVGYDVLTVASEEALTPGFSVPFALTFVVFFSGFLYCGVSASLTLMIPYTQISDDSAFASAFAYNEWEWAKNISSAGAIAAMICTLLGCMITMPRSLYAMASDGIVFKFLSKVSSRTHVPIIATGVGSILICLFSFFLTLKELAEFLSIGTLLAYLLIALSVIVLRYHPLDLITGEPFPISESKALVKNRETFTMRQFLVLLTFVIFSTITNVFINLAQHSETADYMIAYLASIGIFLVFTVLSLTYLSLISVDNKANLKANCRVPFVPYLPGASVFVNIYLMTQLNFSTWIRFGAWMSVGILVYLFYGIKNSQLERGQFAESEVRTTTAVLQVMSSSSSDDVEINLNPRKENHSNKNLRDIFRLN